MGYTGIYIFNMANEATKKSTEKLYKPAEVLKHNTKDDLWLIIHGNVYDVTKFIDEHPGGEEVLVDVGGTDATDAFEDIGHSEDARETLATLKLGKLDGVPLPASANASSAKHIDQRMRSPRSHYYSLQLSCSQQLSYSIQRIESI